MNKYSISATEESDAISKLKEWEEGASHHKPLFLMLSLSA
jgi:hypothetical protein